MPCIRQRLVRTGSHNGARILDTGTEVITLNTMAEQVWDLCLQPTTIEHLVSKLSAEYRIDPAECRTAIDALIARFRASDLLEDIPAPNASRDRYLKLLKTSLTGLAHLDSSMRLHFLAQEDERMADPAFARDIRYCEADWFAKNSRFLKTGEVHGALFGGLGTRVNHTLIGLHGLTHIERLAEDLFASNVKGDFVDAGTWRGGSGIFMRGVQQAFDQAERCVWVADCFEGVPPPTSGPDMAAKLDLTAERLPNILATQREVRDNFADFDLLDGGVKFLPGLFADTLPKAPIGKISLLRLDGDLYSSTLDVLNALYDKVEPGGYVIVDDYALAPCKQAVDEFRLAHGITSPITQLNWTLIHWQVPA